MYPIILIICAALFIQLGNAFLSSPSPFSYSIQKVVSSLPASKPNSAEASPTNKTDKYGVLSPREHDRTYYIKEAERMKQAAQALLAEAKQMEDEILISKSRRMRNDASEIDGLINELFPDTTNKNSTSRMLKNENNSSKRRYTREKLLEATKRLQNQFANKRIRLSLPLIAKDQLAKSELVAVSGGCHDDKLDVDGGNDRISVLTSKLRSECWSPEKLLLVIERLYQRFIEASNSPLFINASNVFDLNYRNHEISENKEDEKRLILRINDLFKAAEILDKETARGVNPNRKWNRRVSTLLESKLQELHDQTKFNLKSDPSRYNTSDSEIKKTAKDKKYEQLVIAAKTSIWLPNSFWFYLLENTYIPISKDDISEIKNEVLAGSKFFCTSVETNTVAASFRGTVREQRDNSPCNYTSIVFGEIQDRMASRKNISEKLQLFFAEDPQEKHGSRRVNVLAVPKSVAPANSSGYCLKSSLVCALTFITTLLYAQTCFALNPTFFKLVTESQSLTPHVSFTCLPIAMGVLAIQAIHEISHRLVARRWKVKLGPSVPLPSPHLGILGALTPFVSFPPNRAALLDIAMSGPLAGMLASLLCLVGGILATLNASKEALSLFPVIPIAYFKGSMLSSLILHFLAPKLMILPNAQPIPIHPAFCVGFAGLITNALNMLPISGFDGGRAVRAILGRTGAFITSIGAVLVLAFACLDNFSPIFFSALLSFVIAQLFRTPPLIRDEVTQINNRRCELYMAAFSLALLALAPYPRAHTGL